MTLGDNASRQRTVVEQLQALDELLLGVRHRFGNYQRLPPFMETILQREGYTLNYAVQQLDLDEARFGFLQQGLPLEGLAVTEIGCNLGYFLLRLAHENHCKTIGFEPIADYCTCIDRMAEIGGIADSVGVQFRGVHLADIDALPAADLIIELNVLHHASAVFDQEAVSQMGTWDGYAQARLSALALKGEYLLFQTGNSAGGETLFPSEDAALFTHRLLAAAGWQVLQIGSIPDLTSLDYEVSPGEQPARATTYQCRRNPDTDLVDYVRDGKLCGSLPTGLANRPIWLCRSQQFSAAP